MIIDDILKSIPVDTILGDSTQPWVNDLLEALNNDIVELELDMECLSIKSSGKELREAILKLPSTKQISLLNDYVVSFGKRRRREADRLQEVELEQKIAEHKLKHDLIKYGAFVFMFLSVVFVAGIIFISWKQGTSPDSEIASGLFTTLIQILKLIFGV